MTRLLLHFQGEATDVVSKFSSFPNDYNHVPGIHEGKVSHLEYKQMVQPLKELSFSTSSFFRDEGKKIRYWATLNLPEKFSFGRLNFFFFD